MPAHHSRRRRVFPQPIEPHSRHPEGSPGEQQSKGFTLYSEIQTAVRDRFGRVVMELFQLEVAEVALGFPPSPEMGELSITSCFDLAKRLRQPPRRLAEQVMARMLPIEGVERLSLAGAGYINVHLDRGALASGLFRQRVGQPPTPSVDAQPVAPASDEATPSVMTSPTGTDASPASGRKVLVEHTSINPNKAAHIGHLRNAVLGDTLVRLLRFRSHRVEVQYYIDNTGVQVADVVVGFERLERISLEQVRKLTQAESGLRFDYYCWDLYARVSRYYETQPDALAFRAATLKVIEEGKGEAAAIADLVSRAITRLHLCTMARLNIHYDLLVQESEILRLDFWKSAFELMKSASAIRYEETGKNQGCWVMDLAGENGSSREGGAPGSVERSEAPSAGEDVKIIVRSNGTVTYVGKDIAYHLWKFGLLGRDFGYHSFFRYSDGSEVWRTALNEEEGAPPFGRAGEAYAVIDSRQAYLQDVVRRAFLALGYAEAARHMHHFSYEVVELSARCAEEMGVALSEEDRKRNTVEVSGRKGLGVKADDLIDALVNKAREEIRARETAVDAVEEEAISRRIAVAALRYFLVKFTRNTTIAFDFRDALAFEGETGPYLQYTVVRARNILNKYREARPDISVSSRAAALSPEQLRQALCGKDGPAFWGLVLLCSQLEMAVDQSISDEEPATLAKFCFRLAQAFNNFYHHHHILHESDETLQNFLLFLVILASETLVTALRLLGIEAPGRM